MIGYGSMPWGFGPWGGDELAYPLNGTLKCAPVVPGTVELSAPGVMVTDDGLGHLVGDGSGSVDYRTGMFTGLILPATTSGSVLATYLPQEGGCTPDCAGCKTHKFRLVIVPGTNIGENQISVTDAFRRLVDKIKAITPIHCTREPIRLTGDFDVQVQLHYDLTEADVVETDTGSFYVYFE